MLGDAGVGSLGGSRPRRGGSSWVGSSGPSVSTAHSLLVGLGQERAHTGAWDPPGQAGLPVSRGSTSILFWSCHIPGALHNRVRGQRAPARQPKGLVPPLPAETRAGSPGKQRRPHGLEAGQHRWLPSPFCRRWTKSLPETLPSFLPGVRLQEQCHGREGLAHRRWGLGDFEVKVNTLTCQAGCQPPQHSHRPGPLLGCGCPWRSAASNIPQDLGFLLSESRTSGFPGVWWALT